MPVRPVQVTIVTGDDSIHTRKYEAGSEVTLSQQEFNEWALGNLIGLIVTGYVDGMNLGPQVGILAASYGNVGLSNTKGEHEYVSGARTYGTTINGFAVEVL